MATALQRELYTEDQIVWWAQKKRGPWWPVRIISVDAAAGTYEYVALDDEEDEEMQTIDEAKHAVAASREFRAWISMKPRKRLRDTLDIKFSPHCQARYLQACARAHRLLQEAAEEIEANFTCAACQRVDSDDETVMCDGCNIAFHPRCAMLDTVPAGAWLCEACAGTPERLVSATVSATVSGAIANVLRNARTSEQSAPELVEVFNNAGNQLPARILARRKEPPFKGIFLEYDQPLPPAGVFVYYAKEDETLEKIVDALYPAVAWAPVLACIVEFQSNSARLQVRGVELSMTPEQFNVRIKGKTPVQHKLRANTRIMLPEYITVSGAHHSLANVAYSYGRPIEGLLELNQARGGVFAAEELVNPNSFLQPGVLILMPPAAPNTRYPRPLGPSSAVSPAIQPPAGGVLRVGERIWLSTRISTVGDEKDMWRPAHVATIAANGDSWSFTVTNVGGDAGWCDSDGPLLMEEEGKEWVRSTPEGITYHPKPHGVAGSGALVPPYAESREFEHFKIRDEITTHVVHPRPKPPEEGWLDSLDDESTVEVSRSAQL